MTHAWPLLSKPSATGTPGGISTQSGGTAHVALLCSNTATAPLFHRLQSSDSVEQCALAKIRAVLPVLIYYEGYFNREYVCLLHNVSHG